jgi:putative component of membrane protein insertase Oxa1/YidC/SpoIIIJ protein YidD
MFCLIFVFSEAHAQLRSELTYILSGDKTQKHIISRELPDIELSELTFLLNGFIKTYQTFLSSQQSPQICTFKPSCSHFGYQSIGQYGVFWGLLMTSDRFVRCHNLNYRYYKLDVASGKLNDPVDIYFIGNW